MLLCGLSTIALAAVLGLGGCDSNEVAKESPIEELTLSPSSASIAVGEQTDFSAIALTASGDPIRDLDLRWWSTDSDVFTVEATGTATGRSPGSALCKVEMADDASRLRVAKRLFAGRDSAFVTVF